MFLHLSIDVIHVHMYLRVHTALLHGAATVFPPAITTIITRATRLQHPVLVPVAPAVAPAAAMAEGEGAGVPGPSDVDHLRQDSGPTKQATIHSNLFEALPQSTQTRVNTMQCTSHITWMRDVPVACGRVDMVPCSKPSNMLE